MSLQQTPASGGRVALLTAGLAVLLVGVFAAGGLLVQRPEPTASAVTTPTTTTSQVPTMTPSPTAPAVTPSRNPRREPDIDRGTNVDYDVYVEVADGWTKVLTYNAGLDLRSLGRGAAAFFSVTTHPLPSRPLLRQDAEAFADGEGMYGFGVGRVRALPVPNRNIVEAASIGFTGRRKVDGATYSLGGECVRLRGAPETYNVSVSICWAAYVQDLGTVRPEVQRMIASAARSI